ncbi:MAG: ATP-binding protein [Anaerolineae bacterium]|nr:ATP-binding protein [Anaerolineae bacterium]
MQSNTEIILDLPAHFNQLELLRNYICNLIQAAPLNLDADRVNGLVYNTQLAFNEIATNVIEHAYADWPNRDDARMNVKMAILQPPLRLEIELLDTGKSFEYNPMREPAFDEVPDRGYGLFLAQHLLEKIEYTPSPIANRWQLVKHLT